MANGGHDFMRPEETIDNILRILIIVDCYYPATKSSAKLVHDLGLEFKSRGHDVIVLCPSDSIKNDFELSIEEGLQIARVRTGKIKGASRFKRALQEIGLSRKIWKKAGKYLSENPRDLIVFYSPSIFFGALVRRLKALWHCKTFLVLRDIFPQWTVDAGVLRKGPIYYFFKRKELEQYAAADVIGVQTPANLKYFSENLSHKKYKLEVLYNWTTLHEPEVPSRDYRRQLGLSGKVIFFFGGNIGVAQDMDNILRLAKSLSNQPEIFFLLVGDGTEVSRLNSMIQREGLSNIKILPAVSQEDYLAMLAEADVGLISLDSRLKTQNVPGKLMSYLYHFKPTLASINADNDLREIIESSESGFCLVNPDDEALRTKALQMAGDKELRLRQGRNARKLLEEKFSVNSAVNTILRHV